MIRRALALALVAAGISIPGVTASGADFTAATATPGNAFSTAADFNTVTVTMADPGTPLQGTVTLAGTADSERGVAQIAYERRLGAGAWTAACTATEAPFSCDWDSTAAADGSYDLRATATDAAGYARTSAVIAARLVDNTDPSVTLADPGPYLQDTATIAATASDAGSGVTSLSIDYRRAGTGPWTQLCSGGGTSRSCPLDSTALPDGDLELRAGAADGAGHSRFTPVMTRRVDNTAPTVATADPGTMRGVVTIGTTADDGAGTGVASVTGEYRPAGTTTWYTACTDATAPYTCVVDTTTAPDGLYDVRWSAVDGTGLTAYGTILTRRVDNTAPSASSLADPGMLSGTRTLTGAGADAGSGVASWTVQYRPAGGGTWSDACTDGAAPWASCAWNTTGVPDGAYDLRAVTTDGAGNTTTSATVAGRTVDNTAPAPADVQAGNVGGGTAGRPETGDWIAFTWTETMQPASILAGWSSGSKAVTLQITNSGSADTVQLSDAAGTTPLHIAGVAADIALHANLVSSTTVFDATMVQAGAKITITLGSRRSGSVRTGGNATMTWRASTAAADPAGNASTGAQVSESGASDRDF